MTGQDPPGIDTQAEAMALLAHAALVQLWTDSDFQPDGYGCCHVCCGTCAALLFLDERGTLDEMLAGYPEGVAGNAMFPGGVLDRAWMYRQWAGSASQQQCGHRFEGPTR